MATRLEASKELAKKQLNNDPAYFSELGKKGAAARKTRYYHFSNLAQNDPEKLQSISSKAGKKSKRGKQNGKS